MKTKTIYTVWTEWHEEFDFFETHDMALAAAKEHYELGGGYAGLSFDEAVSESLIEIQERTISTS